MKLINLTPRDVLIWREGAVIAHFPSQGLARVTQESQAVGRITLDRTTVAIPITAARHGPVEVLPAPELDTAYIVDAQFASVLPGRGDLLVPDDLVRDERGTVIGYRALRTTSSSYCLSLVQ